ncbi:RNA-binding protein FUS-like [Anopheles stephensi]|uniref:RNA-binding protein FUS-like n=1 Tax=Anopheles stephensi TaxID=30069 RepID=UPI001658A358|nr:RNA-binding protein FUS-like [Anopheles stephensi]
MENTSYGINVANRYDLFCIDDDAGDPIEAIMKSKQKQQKKQQQQQQQPQQQSGATTGAAPAAAAAPQSQQAAKSNAKGGEKENKAGGGGRGAENRHPDKSAADAKHAQTNGTGNHLHNQRSGGGERRGIKETQKDNIRNQENQRGTNPGAKFPRGPNKNGTVGGGGGGGDDKYPRKPRDFDGDGQRKPYAQNGAGGAAGGVKRFDGRGKRELDRQSGSNKTGIKAIDKRDGAGSHNWGSSKQDAKEYSNNPDQDYQPQDADTSAEANAERTNVSNGGEEAGADGAGAPKSDDEAKEMTLDEWKAQKAAVRLKPQYNLRKAGEGEDSSQWDKMVALDRKTNPKAAEKGAADGGAAEEDDGNDTQNSKPAASSGGGGSGKTTKQFLEIEYHFNDSRRGGLGRSRGGRGGRGGGGGGGRGMGREGGPGGRREYGGGDNYRGGEEGGQEGRRYNNHYGGGEGGEGGERPQRDYNRRNNRPPMGGGGGAGGPERNYEGGMNNKYSRPNPRSAKQHVPAAPKVDDEHDFPSLG